MTIFTETTNDDIHRNNKWSNNVWRYSKKQQLRIFLETTKLMKILPEKKSR
jgi:hypothetical protein